MLEVVVSSWGYEYPQMPGVRANAWANAWPGVDTQVQGRSSPRRASCLRSSPRTWVRWYARGRRCPEPRPHRHQMGGVAPYGDPCVTCLPVTSPPNGGNCTIRGATRRRHAEGRLLMLQNPPSSPGCGGVAVVNCVPESPASQNIWAITPMLAIVRRGGLHCGRV